ncbi:MAG: ferrochelatase, partial [Gemmatimonadetes bacterium]
MAGEQIAVLLMAYGGPGSLDEVEPYLLDVRGGRPTSPQFVDEIKARYARIGGRSPIRELTEAQAAGVQRVLGERLAVYVGMRHWHPYIRDVVQRMLAEGHRRAVGIVLAPHYSAMSVGAYQKQLLDAAAGRLETALVRSWGDHPKFLDLVAERVAQALQRFPSPQAVQVLFTAHSLPERILASGDQY